MCIQELSTCKQYRLPIKILALNNRYLGMVRQWQELFFDARFSETILSDNPDFVRLASAFDIAGETITRKEEVPAAIARMLASEGAYLLHVSISAEENVWPLVPPGAANQDMMESKP
jgi:acetolactate synthase-1/2/3 large subunit